MMYIFKSNQKYIFSLKWFVLLMLSLLVIVESKYTFNKFNSLNQEKSNLQNQIKNYAMNLADTKFLKITSVLKSEKKKQYNFGNIFSKNNKLNKLDVTSGSILINSKHELSFLSEYAEEDNDQLLKGRKLIARARYTKSLHKIGWSRLYVETFDNVSAEIQSWAAGFLEGKLCAKEIYEFYENLVGIHSKEATYLTEVFEYYKKVEESIRYKTSKQFLANIQQGTELEYWISIAMVQAQTDGLHSGYNSIMRTNPLNFAQIYFINADGEVPELLSVFKTIKESTSYNQYSFRQGNIRGNYLESQKFSKEYLLYHFGSTDPEFVWNKLMLNSHCSAVIKVLKNEDQSVKDVLVGHTTWDSFSEMHRIFKVYKFSYTLYGSVKKNSHITFSSYPGTLTSTDDFYVLNNQVVVLETTLEILDRSLYKTKIPKSEDYIPNYIRISVANRLSNSGKEWTEIFKKNNGGTYNSQWMILDYSKFSPTIPTINSSIFNKMEDDKNIKSNNTFETMADYFKGFSFNFKQKFNTLDDGFFYVLEQIPGYVEIRDMTPHLYQKGYWASYNRPYYEKIYKDSGYYNMMMNYGMTYSYDNNPRAKLIASQIDSVEDIEGFKHLLQYNDNISLNDHINTISPRYDLSARVELRRPSGGIDSKVVANEYVKNGIVIAKSGPSTQGGLKAFDWGEWKNEPHYGLPDFWKFDWIKFDENYVINN